MEQYKAELKAVIKEEMASIISECAPVDRETLDEFLNDTEFLDHVYDHAMDAIPWDEIDEELELSELVESVLPTIAECFDAFYDAIEELESLDADKN